MMFKLKPYLFIAKAGVAATCFFLAFDVMAGEWLVKSGLDVSEVYTDNVELDEDDKDSKFITVVRPTLNFIGNGNRANVSFISAFGFNNLGGGADSFFPRIRANADAELLEDQLFLDAGLSSNQTIIDPFAAAGNSQLNRSDNVTTTYNYNISPYVVRHFGQTADLVLRYTYDDQINKGDELSDSQQQSVLATLKSGQDFARLNWALTVDYQDTDFDDDEDDTTGQDGNSEKLSSSVTLGYQLNRKFQLKSTLGQEWNNYQTFDDDDTDDHFWDVGVIWTPNKRTSFDVGYGKHFYSTTPRFKFSHETRRTLFSASYSRSLTDSRSERINSNVFSFSDAQLESLEQFQLTDAEFDSLEQAAAQSSSLNNNPTFSDQGIFVNELFESSLTLKGKRTTATVYFRDSKQIREDVDQDSIFTSSGVRIERKLSSKYTLNSRLTWDEREDQAGLTSDITQWYLSLRRELGARTAVSISYSYGERDSDRINDDYKENRISLNFSIDL
ncbi:MAG: TIGR03016 family PEP-CTERM system-associated outer membrane protein [Porticoccus sp.]|nr:TIGR03016 family PEP-CTERM system-associated outer membrane protein [Porticoccus sp.]